MGIAVTVSDLDRAIEHLERCGPLAFRNLPPTERSWRGRYALMVLAMGASPAYAWANALAREVPDPDFAAFVAGVADADIQRALDNQGVDIDALCVY